MSEHIIGLQAQDEQFIDEDQVPETGLVAIETEDTEIDLQVAIDQLKSDFNSLQPVDEAAQTLESGVLTGGLLDASEQYGADKVVTALRASFSHGEKATLHDAYAKLIPDRSERRQFVTNISDQDSVIKAVNRINEIGGTQDSSWDMSDQFERSRRFDSQSLAARKQRPHGPRNTLTQFDRGYSTVGFSDVIWSQPELLESPVAEGGDIVDVIKHLRDTYANGAEKYAKDHAKVMERLEAAIAERQRPVEALRDLSDRLIATEVQQLEAALNDIDDEAHRSLIEGMLEDRANDAESKRGEFNQRLDEIRSEILQKLNAEHIDSLVLRAPIEPRPIHDTRNWNRTYSASA